MTFSNFVKSTVNRSIAPLGIKLSRIDAHDMSDVANFIPLNSTLEQAEKLGMTVGDYVDSVMNGVPGSSQKTIDLMTSVGVFAEALHTIVEIGPGTGRYLEKTLKLGRPSRYEIYETARPWSDYLVTTYDVKAQPTDGTSLGATPDRNADLVQAHKVFSTIPFIASTSYWHEIARVVRPGGWVAFDIVTENCLDNDQLRTWYKSGIRNGSYPAVMPQAVACNFFENNGFQLAGKFIVPMPPGTTELFIYRKSG